MTIKHEASFECLWCGRTFTRKDHLKRHQNRSCDGGLSKLTWGKSPSEQVRAMIDVLQSIDIPPEVREGSVRRNVIAALWGLGSKAAEEPQCLEACSRELDELEKVLPGARAEVLKGKAAEEKWEKLMMNSQARCSKCGTLESDQWLDFVDREIQNIADVKFYCLDCGIVVLKGKLLYWSKKGIAASLHIEFPDLTGKECVGINYLPEVIAYS